MHIDMPTTPGGEVECVGGKLPKDARRWRIPTNYDMTAWNPESEPLVVGDDVYDAFSFGSLLYRCISKCYDHGSIEVERAARLKESLIRFYILRKEAMKESGFWNMDDRTRTELGIIMEEGETLKRFIQNQIDSYVNTGTDDTRRPTEDFFMQGFIGCREDDERDTMENLPERLDNWAWEYENFETRLRGRHR